MSNPQKVNALLVKLEHATTGIELNDAITELLNLPAPMDRVAKIVEGRLDEGVYIVSATLAILLVKTYSKTLYEKTFRQFKDDAWALVILYEGEYPDAEIEKVLLKRLYSIASNDADPMRRRIVEAMKKVGSEAVLPTLHAIVHDLEPGAKVGKYFGNALGVIEEIEARSRYSFLQDVLVAIDEIEQRAKSTPPSEVLSAEVGESDRSNVNRRPTWTPGENGITHCSQTIFEKKEGVTVGRRSNTPEINNPASASTIWCTIGVGSKLDADLQHGCRATRQR